MIYKDTWQDRVIKPGTKVNTKYGKGIVVSVFTGGFDFVLEETEEYFRQTGLPIFRVK